MRMLRWLFVLFLGWVAILLQAQNPNGYYNSVNGKKNEELKTALHQIISKHTVLSYGSLWNYFPYTDQRSDGSVWDMYSNNTRTFDNTYGLNREHSFPKSWWGGDQVAAYTDLFHIYPSDSEANTAKSNYPLGEVGSSVYFDNGVSKVGQNDYPGYTGVVFEPDDEYKGDFARTYFYMVTCYQDYYNRWKYFYMISANTYPVLKVWAVNMLLDWHRNDPVSQKELERNEAVFLIQNNRNPFIDFPELAEYIWGNKMDEAFYLDTELTEPVLATPTNDTQLNFGTVVTGQTATLTLYVRGSNLVGNLSVMLFGNDKEQFEVNETSIPAAVANTEEGYALQVTYHPDMADELHEANIVIFDGGIDGSVSISVGGTAIAADAIEPPVAEEATNITASGFTANWQTDNDAEGYILSVFQMDEESGDTVLILNVELDEETSSYDVQIPEPGKNYGYAVRKIQNGLISDYSQTIVVVATAVKETLFNDYIVAWSSNGCLYLRNDSQVEVTIKIFNLSGILIYQDTHFSGSISLCHLKPGVYFVQADDEVRKVMVGGK